MTYVMATVPKKYVPLGKTWVDYFKSIDCHKWVVALEHGAKGYVHWQIRFKVRGCDSKQGKNAYWTAFKRKFPEAHIEFTENWCDYERKEGNFVSSDDNVETIRIRFGVLLHEQRNIIDIVDTQNDREVDVWLDRRGGRGKSWLSLHLYERGRALLVPRYCCTPRELSQYICSAYSGEPYIIIDIPRAGVVNKGLYETIEEIKDGAVFDGRYSGKMRNIRGAKVLIFTNQPLDLKMLSADRWRLHGFTEEDTHKVKRKKSGALP